jgi:RNA polymerase sigma-70 factor (ECF subfamily)
MFRFRQSASPVAESDTDHAPDAEAAVDQRLINAAKSGDLPSFNVLVSRHERPVYGLCLRMLRISADAEDATQDSFIKAWTSLNTFRGGLVRPWLFRIAANTCYDMLRSRGRRSAGSLEGESFEREPVWSSQVEPEDPEMQANKKELGTVLERALAQLPDDQRLIVLLVDLYGYDYEEAAAISGTAIGTVKSRLSRGRGRLRDVLRDDPASSEHFARYIRLSNE